MKKKSLFSFKRKRRKQKSKEQIVSKDKENNFIVEFKKYYRKVNNYFKKTKEKYKEQISALKKFFLIVIGYGLIINFSLHFLIGIDFNLFTLFAWGILYYFISDEFVEWFRRLIAKR